MQKGADIRKRALGDQHLDYAESLAGLAAVYQQQSRQDEAAELQRQSTAIREKVRGDR